MHLYSNNQQQEEFERVILEIYQRVGYKNILSERNWECV